MYMKRHFYFNIAINQLLLWSWWERAVSSAHRISDSPIDPKENQNKLSLYQVATIGNDCALSCSETKDIPLCLLINIIPFSAPQLLLPSYVSTSMLEWNIIMRHFDSVHKRRRYDPSSNKGYLNKTILFELVAMYFCLFKIRPVKSIDRMLFD